MNALDRNILALSIRRSITEPAEIIARLAFFAVLLLVFSKLWSVVDMAGKTFSAADLTWYLGLTEWVILSLPDLHHDIESDVRSGEITYRLARPASYLRTRFLESLGQLLTRLVIVGVGGFGIVWFWAGCLPSEPQLLLIAIPFGVAGAILGLVFYALIGLSAVWIRDVMPLFWIWQKLAFLGGGLILPLDLYPEPVRQIAAASPFGAMLYGTAQWALAPSLAGVVASAAQTAAWLIALAALLIWLERRALRRLEIAGG